MGYLSQIDLTPNPLEERKRERMLAGKPILDLSDSNLTNLTSRISPSILTRLCSEYLLERRYRPDPRGLRSAREAVAAYYTERGAADVAPDGIFFTASTSEGYRLLFSLLGEPGEQVAIPSVGYPLIEQIAAEARLQCLPYPLHYESCGWRYSEDAELGKVSAICVVSPHNPTGVIMRVPPAWLSASHAPIIADEVFCEYVWGGEPVRPFTSIAARRPVFHLHGLSKLAALPDLKLGWIALNSMAFEQYGDRLEHLNDLYLSASSMLQHCVPGIFEAKSALIDGMRAEIRSNIQLIIDELTPCRGIELRMPAAGTFVFPKLIHAADSEALALSLLDEAGVLVHPGFFYGDGAAAHFLISAVTPRPVLEQGLTVLKQCLA